MLVCTRSLLARLNNEQVDSLIEIMLLAAAADGELSIEEIKQLRQCLLEVDELWLTQVDLDERLQAAHARLSTRHRAASLNAAKLVLQDINARKAALELAIRIVATDGMIRTSERELIMETAEGLDVDRDDAADMVKAIAG